MSSSLWIQSKNQNISLLHVPDVYQATDYTCGPSSLTAVLSFYGKEYREMDLANLAKTDPEVGTMP
jgi:predicted double-glycine peptidase